MDMDFIKFFQAIKEVLFQPEAGGWSLRTRVLASCSPAQMVPRWLAWAPWAGPLFARGPPQELSIKLKTTTERRHYQNMTMEVFKARIIVIFVNLSKFDPCES